MILAEKENACAPEKGIQLKTFDILTVNCPGVDFIRNFYSITLKDLSNEHMSFWMCVCLPPVCICTVYLTCLFLFVRILFHFYLSYLSCLLLRLSAGLFLSLYFWFADSTFIVALCLYLPTCCAGFLSFPAISCHFLPFPANFSPLASTKFPQDKIIEKGGKKLKILGPYRCLP